MYSCTCGSHEGISSFGSALEVVAHSLLPLSLEGGDDQLHAPAVQELIIILDVSVCWNVTLFDLTECRTFRRKLIPPPIKIRRNPSVMPAVYSSETSIHF
jgi:hypothetical protein